MTQKNQTIGLKSTTHTKIIILRCYDGDTCTYRKTTTKKEPDQKLRLAGIDAPELNQPPIELSKKSKAYLHQLTRNKICTLKVLETDKYRRIVGLLWCDSIFVNEAMVKTGLAFSYVHLGFKDSFFEWAEKAELYARKNKLHLFSIPLKDRRSPHFYRSKTF